MEKIFYNADTKYTGNLVIIKNGIGLPTIVLLPGIGESLYKSGVQQFGSVKLQLEAIDRRILSYMYADAEKKGYNIVAVGANSSYTKAEILGGLKYAKEELQSPLIGVLPHSNGGYGLFNNLTEEMAGMIDGIVSVAMGPSRNTTTDDIIAKFKIACWFIVSDLDTQVNGNLGDVTEKWHADIIAAGGISWLTLYPDTTITNEHSILASVWQNPAMWPAKGTTPKMSISDFLLSNKQGKQVVAPDAAVKNWVETKPEPAPLPEQPQAEPVPAEPQPAPIKITIDQVVLNSAKFRFPGTTGEVTNNTAEIFWSDKTMEVFKAPPGFRCSGVIDNRKTGTVTLDIRDINNYKQPAIVVGPYK